MSESDVKVADTEVADAEVAGSAPIAAAVGTADGSTEVAAVVNGAEDAAPLASKVETAAAMEASVADARVTNSTSIASGAQDPVADSSVAGEPTTGVSKAEADEAMPSRATAGARDEALAAPAQASLPGNDRAAEAPKSAPGPLPASGDDSSDDDDDMGLPPMNTYWASLLNVSKVADPLPPPPKAAPKTNRSRGEWWRTGKDGGKGGKGKGKYGKGRWQSRMHSDGIGDFVAWAKDPRAADGGRDSSRSPHRRQGSRNLESFMTWAMEDETSMGKEELEDEGPGDSINNFMAWATEGPMGDAESDAEDKVAGGLESRAEHATATKSEAKLEPKIEDFGSDGVVQAARSSMGGDAALKEKEERRLDSDDEDDEIDDERLLGALQWTVVARSD